MRCHLGVMQGRLLPKYKGRYQAHPIGYWQKEFQLVKNMGLSCIEFILDFNDAELNPLLKLGGLDEIKAVSEATGVVVQTVCADYFMEAPLHSEDPAVGDHSYEIMIQLIHNAALLGVTDIVIPCVDNARLKCEKTIHRFVEKIKFVIPFAERLSINLSLETDLPPRAFCQLLDACNSSRVTVNYDLGNSAALGYDPVEELNAYGNKISDIHIKDRIFDGGPVVLGQGSANFDSFFATLKELNYVGPFIMQAYRDDEGVEVFKKQLAWIKPYLEDFGINLTNVNEEKSNWKRQSD